MGTNYYLMEEPCPTCDHQKEGKHISKGVHTWHGTFIQTENPDTFEYEYEAECTSWQDWKKFLLERKETHFIQDSYGERIEIDEFIRRAENISVEDRRKSYDWWATHPRPFSGTQLDVVHPNGEWLDPEGYSFCGREFS